MRRLLAAGMLVAAAVAVLSVTGAASTAPGKHYEFVFDNAFGLVSGGDFKVGGVKAGTITGFRLTHGQPHKALVDAEVTEPGLTDLRSDASCEIRPQSVIGEYYVDCQPGSSRRPLPGNRVGLSHTSSGIPFDLVVDILRRPYRERFRLLLSELGTGLAGRPHDIAEVIRRAHPGLRETNRVLSLLAGQNNSIKGFIADADRVVSALEARRGDVTRFVTTAGRTAEASASRREALRGTVRRLPTFLAELRPTMSQLGSLADQQQALLPDLQRGAPFLNGLLARLRPFARAARPALRGLGTAAAVGNRAARKGRQEAAELRRLARDAPGTAKPLRQLLQTFDDRRRARWADPRAKASSPPAPDPTAIPANGSGGFTGLEALANYAFWQGMAINHFDAIGHALVIVGVANDCVQYETGPVDNSNRDLFNRCNQWLGPYQPGVNAPDPTKKGGAATARSRSGARPISRRGPFAPGTPESPPVPGRPDPSKPHPQLPPPLQQILPKHPITPPLPLPAQPPRAGNDDRANTLLDFLFGP